MLSYLLNPSLSLFSASVKIAERNVELDACFFEPSYETQGELFWKELTQLRPWFWSKPVIQLQPFMTQKTLTQCKHTSARETYSSVKGWLLLPSCTLLKHQLMWKQLIISLYINGKWIYSTECPLAFECIVQCIVSVMYCICNLLCYLHFSDSSLYLSADSSLYLTLQAVKVWKWGIYKSFPSQL